MTGKSQKAQTARGSRSRPRRRNEAPPPQSALVKYRTLLIVLVAAVGVLVVGFVLIQSATANPYTCDRLLTPAPDQAADPNKPGSVTPEQGHLHVPVGAPINYGFCPPTSGNHYNAPPRGPIPAAVYPPAKEQPPGGWVHNLEHGYVVLAYRCPSGVLGQGDCATAEEMAAMQQWFIDAPVDPTCGTRKVLVTRFDSMSTRFGVLSWNRALLLADLAGENLTLATNFRNAWTNVTAPEPNNC